MISARLIGGTAPNAKSWPWAVPARPRLDGAIGDLVQTTAGKWITHRPTRCPNGHPLGPNQVLVGRRACLGHGGGHTTWTCTCNETASGPPLNTHCTALEGPAAVRISNARALADELEATRR